MCVNYVRNDERARETVAQIESAGGRAVAVQADVAKEEDVIRLFDTCEQELGPVKGAVNSAGIVEPYGLMEDLDYQKMLPFIDINVNAALIVSREAVRRMSPRLGGWRLDRATVFGVFPPRRRAVVTVYPMQPLKGPSTRSVGDFLGRWHETVYASM